MCVWVCFCAVTDRLLSSQLTRRQFNVIETMFLVQSLLATQHDVMSDRCVSVVLSLSQHWSLQTNRQLTSKCSSVIMSTELKVLIKDDQSTLGTELNQANVLDDDNDNGATLPQARRAKGSRNPNRSSLPSNRVRD